MISLKNPEQIGKMRDAGALLYEVLCRLREAVQPGMSTAALDVYAEQLIRKNHAIPSFLHYEGYPASICASIDDAVVHGISSEKQIRLRKGMTIAIEPMISAGDWHITCDADQWCYRTRDRSLTSHYEHTIAINEDGLPEILTYPDFKWEDK